MSSAPTTTGIADAAAAGTLDMAARAGVPPWLIAPFGLLLLLIAVMPLTPTAPRHFWEKRYPFVSIGLGLAVAAYYLFCMPRGAGDIAHTLHEYFSFICLIGSLFTVAGGIHITIRGGSSPGENVAFLATGALLANFIGTTGASMVLIRPWMKLNRTHLAPYHIVFFIFIVSNIGGALTPIGDPPLFLGFLRGVPFFWLVERVTPEWFVTCGLVLAVFYFIDLRAFRKMPRRMRAYLKRPDQWHFDGTMNVLFLFAIIAAVFLPQRWLLREFVMIGAAAASYLLTPRRLHELNAFHFAPFREVAFLFAGIFLTMMPALGYLDANGARFGLDAPLQYYFATGSLSSVLDNAPTYVTFLELARSSAGAATVPALLDARPLFVCAVSLGAVFFGAMTYIGNGPNFMVKSIAESSGVPMPAFFGYILKYSLPILLPILALTGWVFLR